jgi:DNA-binding HxlR family transcriptional regulator
MNTVRTYGQFCGLARALEIVGERWSLLIVRDLVLGPKRYDELQAGLPKMPASILSSRLNELEQSGVVRRRVRSDLDAGVVYELTEYGNELDQILLDLGLWGARSLGRPEPEDVFTVDSAILNLYTTFQPANATGVQIGFELHYHNGLVVNAVVADGNLRVGEGGLPGADLVIVPQGPGLMDLFTGAQSAADVVRAGRIRIDGKLEHLELFTQLFHIPSAPEPPTGLTVH